MVYSPWSCKESDTTEHACLCTHTHTHVTNRQTGEFFSSFIFPMMISSAFSEYYFLFLFPSNICGNGLWKEFLLGCASGTPVFELLTLSFICSTHFCFLMCKMERR